MKWKINKTLLRHKNLWNHHQIPKVSVACYKVLYCLHCMHFSVKKAIYLFCTDVTDSSFELTDGQLGCSGHRKAAGSQRERMYR